MSESENLKQKLAEKFSLLPEQIILQRERRLWLEVPYDKFADLFDFLVKSLGFSQLSTITGLDEGTQMAFIYHLKRDDGIVFNLKTKILKDQESIKTIIDYFPGGAIYERELIDVLGAKVEGLPPGLNYPLPDDWPAGQYPLRKDWDPASLNKEGKG